jgi:magnesium-transporting ATPase (P-type)
LLFAATVSAFTGDIPSFIIIAVIVLMSVFLDVTQEYQAQCAADSLRKQVLCRPRCFAMAVQSISQQHRSCRATSCFWLPVT